MNKVIKSMVAIVLAVTMMFSGAVSAFAWELPSIDGLKTAAALAENATVLTAVAKGEYSKDEVKEAAICAVDTTFNVDVVEMLSVLKEIDLSEVKATLEGIKAALEAELKAAKVALEAAKKLGLEEIAAEAEKVIAEIEEKKATVDAALEAIDAVIELGLEDVAAKAEKVAAAVEAKLEELKANVKDMDVEELKANVKELKEMLLNNEDVQEIIDFVKSVELEDLKKALDKVAATDWEAILEDVKNAVDGLDKIPEIEIPEVEIPEINTSELKEVIAKLEKVLSGEFDVAALEEMLNDLDGVVANLIVNFCKHLTKECACFPKEDVKVVLGDVDGDGDIDNIDAMYTLQYFVGIEPACDFIEAAADVDVDGDIDNVDAMFILQHFVGIPTVF